MKAHILATMISGILLATTTASASSIIGNGGVTGGGGNTVTTGFATPDEVVEIIRSSKDQAISVARKMGVLGKVQRYPDDIWEKIRSMYTVRNELDNRISALTIQVLKNRPCYDMDGNPRAGSYDPRNPQFICMSASEISKNVYKGDVSSQVVALILHEVSHMYGLDENTAIEFQMWILNTIKEETLNDPSYSQEISNVPEELSRAFNFFQSVVIPKMQALQSTTEHCKLIDDLNYDPVFTKLDGGYWSLLNVDAGVQLDGWKQTLMPFSFHCGHGEQTISDPAELLNQALIVQQGIRESWIFYSSSNGFKVEIY